MRLDALKFSWECGHAQYDERLKLVQALRSGVQQSVYLFCQGCNRWSQLSPSTRIHRPPEHMPQNRNLLLLDLLERVVLVRMLVSVKASQANSGGRAVHLLDP